MYPIRIAIVRAREMLFEGDTLPYTRPKDGLPASNTKRNPGLGAKPNVKPCHHVETVRTADL